MRQQIHLLTLQHFPILIKNIALAFANRGRQGRIFWLEITRHAPEIPMGGSRFGSDEVDHDAGCLDRRIGCITALPGMRHTDFDHDVTGGREVADLPAIHRHVIGQSITTQGLTPERRRHDVVHEATGHHRFALETGIDGRFVNFLLADTRSMHIGFMRKVHEVIDHEAIVAVDMVTPAAIRPFRTHGPCQMRDLRGISQARLARPDPDEAITLHHRETTDAGKAANPLLRHGDHLALTAHHQTMIAAGQPTIADRAQRKRRAAMRTKIFQRRDLIFRPTVKDDFFAANLPPQRLIQDLIRRTGDVPGIFGIQVILHIAFVQNNDYRIYVFASDNNIVNAYLNTKIRFTNGLMHRHRQSHHHRH